MDASCEPSGTPLGRTGLSFSTERDDFETFLESESSEAGFGVGVASEAAKTTTAREEAITIPATFRFGIRSLSIRPLTSAINAIPAAIKDRKVSSPRKKS